jgi:hypothetical protein
MKLEGGHFGEMRESAGMEKGTIEADRGFMIKAHCILV